MSAAIEKNIFGYTGKFADAQTLKTAALYLADAGVKKYEAHSPHPIHGLEAPSDTPSHLMPFVVLGAAVSGGLAVLLLQGLSAVKGYAVVLSGKPLLSWPAFIPIAACFTVLIGANAVFLAFSSLGKLPAFYHPFFKHPQFEIVSNDGYLLSIEVTKEMNAENARALLEECGAEEITEIEN